MDAYSNLQWEVLRAIPRRLKIIMLQGPHLTAVGISLREGESKSSNSFNFQNNYNFQGSIPWVLRCFSETVNVCHQRGSYRTLPSKH